jgi:VIT1/CCC1 family predicted Fe2+/Mn2+ transporter
MDEIEKREAQEQEEKKDMVHKRIVAKLLYDAYIFQKYMAVAGIISGFVLVAFTQFNHYAGYVACMAVCISAAVVIVMTEKKIGSLRARWLK